MARTDPRDAMIELLMKQNADLLDRFQELVGQVHTYQVDAAKQAGEAQLGKRWHVSEDEEDLYFQREMGEITEAELKERLAALNFDNTDISQA